jgi:hypothetical protein
VNTAMNFGLHEMLRNSEVTELLVDSHKGLRSLELVILLVS